MLVVSSWQTQWRSTSNYYSGFVLMYSPTTEPMVEAGGPRRCVCWGSGSPPKMSVWPPPGGRNTRLDSLVLSARPTLKEVEVILALESILLSWVMGKLEDYAIGVVMNGFGERFSDLNKGESVKRPGAEDTFNRGGVLVWLNACMNLMVANWYIIRIEVGGV